MSATATVSQIRPVVSSWHKGKRPEEQGWVFDGQSLSRQDLLSVRSFAELVNKGVPQSICDAARKAGYMPAEMDEYLDETGY
jgi:hypothetical protein